MADAGFAIYVHWPFCQSKCPYCDFNSHVAKTIDHAAWARAYVEEIQKLRDYRSGEVLTSVYFGGGTPSTAEVSTIDAILQAIHVNWSLQDAEITMEANPTSVEAAKFKALATIGVNRISLGFQAFNDRDLKRLGRLHSTDESLKALEIAKTYFRRTNFDLIYARQDQGLEDWQNELCHALEFAPDHLSLYQLAVEQGTAFGDLYNKGKLKGLPSDDLAAEMYEWTSEEMGRMGYAHYEVSNFAKPGEESRHNLVYWRGGEYIGIGPGAHGRITIDGQRYASVQTPNPNQWLLSNREAEMAPLSPADVQDEYVMMALRLSEGAELARLPEMDTRDLEDQGLMWRTNARIGATRKGRLLLNALLRELLIGAE